MEISGDVLPLHWVMIICDLKHFCHWPQMEKQATACNGKYEWVWGSQVARVLRLKVKREGGDPCSRASNQILKPVCATEFEHSFNHNNVRNDI